MEVSHSPASNLMLLEVIYDGGFMCRGNIQLNTREASKLVDALNEFITWVG